MKEIGYTDWLIDAILEFYAILRAGYAAQTTTAFEKITGRKPILFSQFAKDYAKDLARFPMNIPKENVNNIESN